MPTRCAVSDRNARSTQRSGHAPTSLMLWACAVVLAALASTARAADPVNYNLTINLQGEGTTPLNSAIYPDGTPVVVQVSASPGWQFDHWTGDVLAGHETENPLTVTMDQDRTLTAVFLETDTTSTSTSCCATGVAPAALLTGLVLLLAGLKHRP